MRTTFHKLFIEDFWLKLFALIVAVWIYGTVRQTQGRDAEKSFQDLPVLVLSTASQASEVRVSPERVSVTVRGDSRALERLLPRDVHPVVDLTVPGALAQSQHRVVASVPPGLTASAVEPRLVEIIQLPPNPRRDP